MAQAQFAGLRLGPGHRREQDRRLHLPVGQPIPPLRLGLQHHHDVGRLSATPGLSGRQAHRPGRDRLRSGSEIRLVLPDRRRQHPMDDGRIRRPVVRTPEVRADEDDLRRGSGQHHDDRPGPNGPSLPDAAGGGVAVRAMQLFLPRHLRDVQGSHSGPEAACRSRSPSHADARLPDSRHGDAEGCRDSGGAGGLPDSDRGERPTGRNSGHPVFALCRR